MTALDREIRAARNDDDQWQRDEWRAARDEQSAWEHPLSCRCRQCEQEAAA